MRLTRIGRDYTYGEARDWILELLRETGSHMYADMIGLERAGSQAEMAVIMHAEWYMNRHRDRELAPDPVHVPGPWASRAPNADVTPAMRAEYEARLNTVSAFPT